MGTLEQSCGNLGKLVGQSCGNLVGTLEQSCGNLGATLEQRCGNLTLQKSCGNLGAKLWEPWEPWGNLVGTLWGKVVGTLWNKVVGTLWEQNCGNIVGTLEQSCGNLGGTLWNKVVGTLGTLGTLQEPGEPCGNLAGTLWGKVVGSLWNKVVGTLWNKTVGTLWNKVVGTLGTLQEPCRNLAGTLGTLWAPGRNLGTLWEPRGNLGAPACSETLTMAEDPKACCCWGIEDYHQLEKTLAVCTQTKNCWSRRRSFPPELLVFGKMCKFPASVHSDTKTPAHLQALEDTPEGIRFRQELEIREHARKAFAQVDNIQVLRRAWVHQSRPARGNIIWGCGL